MTACIGHVRPRLTPADVAHLRREGCGRAEIGAYAGLDVATVRSMEIEASQQVIHSVLRNAPDASSARAGQGRATA